MTIKVKLEDALKSGYLYIYATIGLATCIFVALFGNYLMAFLLFVTMVPYIVGIFSATKEWSDSNRKELAISFPYGGQRSIFSNIETQMLITFVGICFLSIGVGQFYNTDAHVAVVLSIAAFFVFVHQLIIISAINRSAVLFCLPIFILLTAGTLAISMCKNKIVPESILSKLDYNGYPIVADQLA